MRVLGIESTCDETAAAVIELRGTASFKLLSSVISSQVNLHRQFGGVVPEVAARSHLEVILPIIQKALREAFQKDTRDKRQGTNKNQIPNFKFQIPRFDPWDQIDGIAISHGPGLPGALLVGVTTAKTLALVKAKPLIGVDHVKAHLYAAWLDKASARRLRFPLLGLIVSGGHTQLVLFASHERYQLLGQTVDDAVGEAFDKVAKMLGLGFPGGPALAKAAAKGNAQAYKLPLPKLEKPYDFSFSGLKTAVLRHLQKLTGKGYNFPSFKLAKFLTPRQVNDTAASFEAKAVEILVAKTMTANQEFSPQAVVVAGGVASNLALRDALRAELGAKVIFPPTKLCTDNAAMIATLGAMQLRIGATINPLKLETMPSLSM